MFDNDRPFQAANGTQEVHFPLLLQPQCQFPKSYICLSFRLIMNSNYHTLATKAVISGSARYAGVLDAFPSGAFPGTGLPACIVTLVGDYSLSQWHNQLGRYATSQISFSHSRKRQQRLQDVPIFNFRKDKTFLYLSNLEDFKCSILAPVACAISNQNALSIPEPENLCPKTSNLLTCTFLCPALSLKPSVKGCSKEECVI